MTYEEEARNALKTIYDDMLQKHGDAPRQFLIAIAALEKQIPMKVIIAPLDHGYQGFTCPRCGGKMYDEPGDNICYPDMFCSDCGQRLDWTEYDPDVEQKHGYDPDQDWSKADE